MKICYFGIYNPDLGRNRIYIRGFEQNEVEVIECHDNSRGPLKFLKLFFKHQKIKNDYDFMIIGYPGHVVVWLGKLLSKKPVIFDALCSMYEGVILSRGQYGFLGLKNIYVQFVDWLAVKCADIVLVETESQKKYFEARFGKSEKYKIIYTGADNSLFFIDEKIKKREKFTVVFRGKFLPEAGLNHILQTAKLLENQGIFFLVLGNGWLEKEVKSQIKNLNLKNLKIITDNLSFDNLRELMLSCHMSLGQFENHERLKRTIPHKCFESLAMGLPYVTAKTAPVAEILKDGESCIFVNQADPKDLAEKILRLKNNPDLAKEMGENGYKIYLEKFTPKKLAQNILAIR